MENVPLRLLVVEDSEEDALLLIRRLRREGFDIQVLRVDTPEEMQEALSTQAFDAVVSDHNMPAFDSFGALTILHAAEKDLPFIVLSASIGEDTAIELMRQGAHDFVMKDKASRLGQVIRRELQEAQNRRERREAREALQQRNAELEALNNRLRRLVEVARRLSGCRKTEEFGRRLLEDFARNMAAKGGSVYLAEDKGLRLVHAIDPGHAPAVVPYPLKDRCAFQQAMASREVVLIRNTTDTPPVASSGWDGYQDSSALVFPLLDESGEILGMLSLHNKTNPPFTEQDREIGMILASYSSEALKAIRATEALQESEYRFREIAETLPQFVYEADTNGKITFANSRSLEFFGFTKEQLQRDINVHDLLVPESRDRARTSFLTIVRDGVRNRGTEYEALRKDGSTFPILSYAAPIERDGANVGVRGIVVDITELKEARGQSGLLMHAIEQAIESTVITDANGVIQYVNRAFEQTTGYGREEAIGNTPRILKSGRHDPAFYAEMWRTIGEGSVYHNQIINKRKDGALFTEETTISPVRDDSGAVTNFIAVKRDITRELDLEEQYRQAQRMEAIGQLAGGVAHDFNNILQGILGYAEMARQAVSPDGRVQNYVDEIAKAGKRAAVLVRQLLTFSRRQAMHAETHDLNLVVDDLLKMLTRVLGENIQIDFRNSRVPAWVYGDKGMMEQVVMNLCVNARDAMPKGGVITIDLAHVAVDEAFCEAHVKARQGDFVRLKIADTGAGMDRETLDKVFEPFFTTKEAGKGTGLGLATVYGIVEQHQGFITVWSEPDCGAVFSIYLPSAEEAAHVPASHEESVVTERTGTILVAEDEELVRCLVEQILVEAGHTVICAKDGEEALVLFGNHEDEIDLALLDLVMPNLSGADVFTRLRERRPNLPVLFTSGYSETVVHSELVMREGMMLIQKPYTYTELLSAIQQMLP